MHITRYTDYSLRVLIYLAAEGDRLTTIQEIADSYDISRNHLMKVVHQLNKKGYIETVRGKKGGMRLHMAPADINIECWSEKPNRTSVLWSVFLSETPARFRPSAG